MDWKTFRRHGIFALVASVVLVGLLSSQFLELVDAEAPEPVEALFSHEPGGRTIGGPGQTWLKGGTAKKELFGFLSRGPTPVRFVCVTGANVGPGAASLIYRSRIGQTIVAEFAPGDSRVVCGQTTAIKVECHGQGKECQFLWRVDEPR